MRRRLTAGAVAIGVASMVAITAPSPAAACVTGARIDPGPGQDQRGGVVFTGTAVRVEYPWSLTTDNYDPAHWTFVVDDVRTGQVDRRYTVDTDRDSGVACGYPFRLGGRYLLLVPGPGVDAPFSSAGRGVERLDELPDPPRVEGEHTVPPALPDPWIPVLVLAAAGAVLWLALRRRPPRRLIAAAAVSSDA